MPLDIENLYRRHGSMVFRRCRQLLRDEGEAKDAMQDTFVKLMRAEASLDESYPISLLYKMATQVCLNRIRTRGRRPEDRDEALLFGIAAEADLEATLGARRFLNRLFGREKDSTRVMAVLHFLDGMTLEEVARECGLSVSGVRFRLRKIKAMAHGLAAGEDSGPMRNAGKAVEGERA